MHTYNRDMDKYNDGDNDDFNGDGEGSDGDDDDEGSDGEMDETESGPCTAWCGRPERPN